MFAEYKDYIHFIELSHEYASLRPISLLGPTIFTWVSSLLCSGLFVASEQYVSLDLFTTKEFAEMGIARQACYIWLYWIVAKLFYYTALLCCEASAKSCGFAFDSYS